MWGRKSSRVASSVSSVSKYYYLRSSAVSVLSNSRIIH